MSVNWHEKPDKEATKGAALIDKAFRLIDIIGISPGHVSIQNLVRETGWARPTLYRILAAVTANGYLRLDPVAQGYTLGYRFLELAQNVWSGPDLAAVASGELRRLRDITGETAYLAVPHDGAMMALGKFEGTHAVRSAARLGMRKPLHCTSQGKAVLAFLPEQEVDRLVGVAELERFTANTITHPGQLKLNLSIVRQRGYAIEDEEIIIGNRCVGAPILDQSGRPIAAISVAGPTWRLTGERAEQLGPEIALVARNIGAQLRGADGAVSTGSNHPMAHPSVVKPAFYGADPAWDASKNILMWTDRLGPAVFSTGSTSSRNFPMPQDAPIIAAASLNGSINIWQNGRHSQLASGAVRSERSYDAAKLLAVAVHPSGAIWCATSEGEGSSVGEIDVSSPTWTMNGKISGLAWKPDGSVLFAADAQKGTIYSLQVGTKTPRVFSRIARVSGEPRAITVDPTGKLWVALYDGWSVARISEEGEIEHVSALPVPRPTGLTFGGDDMKTLFITTARVGLSREVLDNAPLSGKLLVCRS